MSSRHKMPGRRSLSVEPEELAAASPRRSTRIRAAVHVDSPAPKKETGAEKPAAAGRRTRRAQSIQEKSLNDIEDDLKKRDESPLSLKINPLDTDKIATPTRRVKRSSSLQNDFNEDIDSKPIRRTRKSLAAKDIPSPVEEEKENEEEMQNTPEHVGPGRPKRRVTRSMSRSPVDTQNTKPATSAPATRKYRLSLNKDSQDVAKPNALDIIKETEDESDKAEKASAKSPSKSQETKKDLLNNNLKKVATVTLEKIDISNLEYKDKTEVEDSLQKVPKSSDEEVKGKKIIDDNEHNHEEVKLEEIENQSGSKVHDTSHKEKNVKEIKKTSEEHIIISSSDEEFELFLDTSDNEKDKLPEKTQLNEQEELSETNELIDSETNAETVILETSRKEKDNLNDTEDVSEKQIEQINNKTIDKPEDQDKTQELNLTKTLDKENDDSFKSDQDSNISLVCDKIIEVKAEKEEDETNISIVGSVASSPKSISSPLIKPNEEVSNNKGEEHGQNLSLVNDDGRTYSPIVENITIDLDPNDSILNSSTSTPSKKPKNAIDGENTDVEIPESPKLNDRRTSSVERSPSKRKSKKLSEEEINEISADINESTKLDVSKQSTKTNESPELDVEKTPSKRKSKNIFEGEINENSAGTTESPKLDVNKKSTETIESPELDVSKNSVEKTPSKRKSKTIFEEEINENSAGTTESPELDVSKNSVENTPSKRKSKKLFEEEINENSAGTSELPKLGVSKQSTATNESPELDISKNSVENTPSKRKSKKLFEEEINENSACTSELSKLDVSKQSTETNKSPELDVSNNSVKNTPSKRKSKKLFEEEMNENSAGTSESPKLDISQQSNETIELPELNVSKKSGEKTTSKRKSKKMSEEENENSTSTTESPKLDISQQSTETIESPKLEVNKKSVEKTPSKKKSKKLSEEENENSAGTTESPKLDISNKQSTETIELPELDVTKKSAEKTTSKRKSKKMSEEENENSTSTSESAKLDINSKQSTETIESPEPDVNTKSVDKTPSKRISEAVNEISAGTPKSPKLIVSKQSSETIESPKLGVSKKTIEKTASKRKSKKISEEINEYPQSPKLNVSKQSTETIESPKLDVSKKSDDKTPKSKSKKLFDEVEDSAEESESPKLDVSKKSVVKTSRKSNKFSDDEERNKEFTETADSSPTTSTKSVKVSPAKTPSSKKKSSKEEINEDNIETDNNSAVSENKDMTPTKSIDSKNKAEQDRDKMLDDYLASYTAEKKRKRNLDETNDSMTLPEEKKKRKNIREIDFSDSEEYDSDNENRHEFLDDMAFEGSEDTPSIDSNEIIDEGESIGSTGSEFDSDEDYEHGSFVVDNDVGNELLSGDDELLEDSVEHDIKNKRKRIITIIDSSDEDVDNLSMKAFGGMSPSLSISSVNQTISVDSDLDLLKNKNEELSKQIEEGSRKVEDQSVIVLEDDSYIELDKSIVEDTNDENSKNEADTQPAKELNKSVEIVQEIETPVSNNTIEPEKEEIIEKQLEEKVITEIIGKQSQENEILEPAEKETTLTQETEYTASKIKENADLKTAEKDPPFIDSIVEKEKNLNSPEIEENEETILNDSVIKESKASLIEEKLEITNDDKNMNEFDIEETKEGSIVEQQEPKVTEKEETINDSKVAEKLDLNDSSTDKYNEKYQELFDQYFKQFEEDGVEKKSRRETLGELPTEQKKAKSKKRERRQSLGSKNPVEEARQRFDIYCQKIKEKQERKRTLSESKENINEEDAETKIETKLKRKSLSKLNESKENMNTTQEKNDATVETKKESKELLCEPQIIITKSTPKRKKSLSLDNSIVVQEEVEKIVNRTPKTKIKCKSSVSYEMNTSGVYEVSPLKLDDTPSTGNAKSEFLNEASEMLKDFNNCLNEETELVKTEIYNTPKTDKFKIASETTEDSQETVISKKKIKKLKSPVLTAQKNQNKKIKLNTSDYQFEDLADVNLFQSPLRKKLKTVNQFDDISEVNILHSPITEKKSMFGSEQVESIAEKKKKKTEKLKAEIIRDVQKKKKRTPSESESFKITSSEQDVEYLNLAPIEIKTSSKLSKQLKTGVSKVQKKKSQKTADARNLEIISVAQEESVAPFKVKKSPQQSEPLKTDVSKVQKKKKRTLSESESLKITSSSPKKSPEHDAKCLKLGSIKIKKSQQSEPLKTDMSKVQKKKKRIPSESDSLKTISASPEKSPIQDVKKINFASIKVKKSPQQSEPLKTDMRKAQKKKSQKTADARNLEIISVEQEELISPVKVKKSPQQSEPLKNDVSKVQKKKKRIPSESESLKITSPSSKKSLELSPVKVKKLEHLKTDVSKVQKKKSQQTADTRNLEIISVKEEKSPVQTGSSEKKKRKLKKKSTSSESSGIDTDSSEIKRQKISDFTESDSSLENKSPNKKPTKSRKEKPIKSTSSVPSALKVKHENIMNDNSTFKIDNRPSTSKLYTNQSKGAGSKFIVKREKIQPSISEYTYAAEYFPSKSNKYKNLIKPSKSGWTDQTVTVMNLSHASHGIKKPKRKHRKDMLKASLAGNVNKFHVEEMFSGKLVKSIGSVFKLQKSSNKY